MLHRTIHGSLSMLLGIHCATALAADDATELQNVVVTASAVEQKVQDAPASISVITAEDIAAKPVRDIADLIGGVEGVTLRRAGNGVAGVQIRGFDPAYTAILIDGRRVNSTSASFRGNDYDTGWVPADMIERIEVVRGPMSSLYGSDAIGGVVNIITKKASDRWRGTFDTTLIQQENSGAGNSWKTSASLSGPLLDNLFVKLYGAADRREADGDVNALGFHGMPRHKNNAVNGELRWQINDDHSLTVNADSARRNHSDNSDDFTLRRKAYALTHHGNYRFGSSEFSLNLDETRNLDGVVAGANNPNKATTDTAQGRLHLPLGASRLSLGGEWKRERLNDPTNLSGWPGTTASGSPTTQVETRAAFVEYELPLRDDLTLTLGNRFDDHENFGGHNSPRAYLLWKANDHLRLKGGWAKAFRAPTLLQNSPNWGSVSCGSATTGCYIVGSAELEPETSVSREIGISVDYARWGGGLTVFHNELKNMIDINNRTRDVALAPSLPNFVGFLADGRPVFAYENLNKVRTQGAELSAHAALGANAYLRVNYTYLDAKNLSDTASSTIMTYRPRHVANANLDWSVRDDLLATLSARYSGTQYLNTAGLRKQAYTLIDLGVRYDASTMLTLGAGILNLFDKGVKRDYSTDFNEEQRRFYVSASLKF